MYDKHLQVFKQPTDHNRWDRQIEVVSTMNDLEEGLRIEIISALNFLEMELGSGFLKTKKLNHPIRQMISNKAEWQLQELIQFVATLKTLKECDSNYSKLIKKLLSIEKSRSEGIPFVEIAGGYLKENFLARFLDESTVGKSPDIEIVNPENNDKFFIEVSMVNDSEKTNLLTDNYYFLHHQFHFVPPIYLCTGRQKAEIAKIHYTEIQKIISTAKKEVEASQQIVSYSDERFEFSLAPFDLIEKLNEICEQNGTQRNDISGLPLSFDETGRLVKNKIKLKSKQIPINKNGLLYFPVNPLFFMTTHVANSIDSLEKCIGKFTNILGVVLYSKILGQLEEQIVEMGKHIFIRTIINQGLCHELLFIYNHNCKLIIQDDTINKIYKTFKI